MGAAIEIVVAGAGGPCPVCGRLCGPRLTAWRPEVRGEAPAWVSEAARRSAAAQATAWRQRVPRAMSVCRSHFAAALLVGDQRVLRQQLAAVFFEAFGHPLQGERVLWRRGPGAQH